MDAGLAARIRAEREGRGWSLAELAEHSGVSRAMISRIERAEASPTAALLGRLAGAFRLTMSTLLARAEADAAGGGRVARAAEQHVWRDPATGYIRRAVSPPGIPLEIVRVELPPGATVPYPAFSYRNLAGHCIWVLSGTLHFREGAALHRLEAGDCLALGTPASCAYHNPGEEPCTYVVALARME